MNNHNPFKALPKTKDQKFNADILLKKIKLLPPDKGVLLGVLLPEALHLALQVGDNKAELPASRPRRALQSKKD